MKCPNCGNTIGRESKIMMDQWILKHFLAGHPIQETIISCQIILIRAENTSPDSLQRSFKLG